MKQTDLDRKERELKKARKKQERLDRGESAELTPGEAIKQLHSYFFHDENKIYNIDVDERIPDLLESIQLEIEERHWDSIIRKAVNKTKVKERDEAIKALKAYLDLDE